jgi:hypothetical protein
MMASLSPTAGVVGLALISSTIAMAACWVLMEGRLAAERSKCGMKGDEGHRASRREHSRGLNGDPSRAKLNRRDY